MPVRYTVKELIKIIEADGWVLNRAKGSHYIYLHKNKKGSVTIPFHKGTIHPFVVNSVLKQAGLK